jgi:hypothetical protein
MPSYFAAFYAVVQPKENTQLILYKLDCFATKNYYSPNQSLSECLNKKYSKDKDVQYKTIRIMDCFRLFMGELDTNINKFVMLKSIQGLHVCCYLPSEYLEDIYKSQHGLPCVRLQFVENALLNQKKFFNQYIHRTNEINRKYLEKYFTLKRAIKLANKGNFVDNVPSILHTVLLRLRKSNTFTATKAIPEDTYELQRVQLVLPDGRNMKFSLMCSAEYNGCFTRETRKKYKAEKIHKYTLVFNWV